MLNDLLIELLTGVWRKSGRRADMGRLTTTGSRALQQRAKRYRRWGEN